MKELLRALCALDGVSSFEDPVRDYIRDAARPHADSLYEDVLGNLIVFKKGRRNCGKTVMLAAHMDEVGLIVKSVTDDGFLRFGLVGGIDRKVLLGTRVRIGERRAPGVIGVKAVHMTDPEERKKLPKTEDMYIDIGASSKEEAEALARPGDMAAFCTEPEEFGEGFFKAKALDDRLGCAVLLTLLGEEPAVDAWFVFTVQEETGLRGAGAAAYRIRPDIGIVIEGTTAADLPFVEGAARACRAGGGAVVPVMDGATVYDPALVRTALSLAEKRGIPCQTKTFIAGGTDAGKISLTADGAATLAVSAAVRYIHSPASCVSLSDVQAVCDLTREILNHLGGVI